MPARVSRQRLCPSSASSQISESSKNDCVGRGVPSLDGSVNKPLHAPKPVIDRASWVGTKPFCQECGYWFSSIDKWITHELEEHGREVVRRSPVKEKKQDAMDAKALHKLMNASAGYANPAKRTMKGSYRSRVDDRAIADLMKKPGWSDDQAITDLLSSEKGKASDEQAIVDLLGGPTASDDRALAHLTGLDKRVSDDRAMSDLMNGLATADDNAVARLTDAKKSFPDDQAILNFMGGLATVDDKALAGLTNVKKPFADDQAILELTGSEKHIIKDDRAMAELMGGDGESDVRALARLVDTGIAGVSEAIVRNPIGKSFLQVDDQMIMAHLMASNEKTTADHQGLAQVMAPMGSSRITNNPINSSGIVASDDFAITSLTASTGNGYPQPKTIGDGEFANLAHTKDAMSLAKLMAP